MATDYKAILADIATKEPSAKSQIVQKATGGMTSGSYSAYSYFSNQLNDLANKSGAYAAKDTRTELQKIADGQAKHDARMAEVEKKRADYGSALTNWIHLNSQWADMQNAPAEEKAKYDAEYQQAQTALKEARAGKKEAKALETYTANWEGRDEKIAEYNRLQNAVYANNADIAAGGLGDPALANAEQKLVALREEIQRRDQMAGNGVRDLNASDRMASVIAGGMGSVSSGLTDLAGHIGEAVDRGVRRGLSFDTAEIVGYDETGAPIYNYTEEQRKANADKAASDMSRIYAAADNLSEQAAADLTRAKEGQNALVRAGIDIGVNVVQMGFDAGVALATGGSSLAAMFARVAGESMGEARREGATLEQRFAYGFTKATIEVATEKMFDGLAGIYGKGKVSEDVIETLVRRLSNSKLGQSTLRLIASGTGEGIEELVSGVLDPIAKGILTGKVDYNELDLSELMYDAFIGFAIGFFGGGTQIANGQSRAANAQNSALSATYQQIGENPTFRQELRDRALANDNAYIGQHDPQRERQQMVRDALINASQGRTRSATVNPNAPQSSSEQQTEFKTDSQLYVSSVIEDNTLSAEEKSERILSSGINEAAFEEVAGVELEGTREEKIATILKTLQNGAESQESTGGTDTADEYVGKHEARPRELNNGSKGAVLASRSPVKFDTQKGSEIVYDDDGTPRTRADIVRAYEADEAAELYGNEKSKTGLNSAAYNDAVDSAIEDVRDDPRNVSQIADGEGTYAGLSLQERADLLNFLSSELDPESGYSDTYLPGGGEWYVSNGEVVRAEEGIRGSWRSDGKAGAASEFVRDEDSDYSYTQEKQAPSQAEIEAASKDENYVGKHEIPMRTQMQKDVADTHTPRATDVRTLTEQQAKNEDTKRERERKTHAKQENKNSYFNWLARRMGITEQEARARDAEAQRQKKVDRLKRLKADGYIIHRLLGEPATKFKNPDFVALQKDPAALREFVDGKGKWAEWSARARLDMLERLFPEANWKLEHTAPGWEANSENGINYPGGRSTATPDVITLERTTKQQDASNWPANYKVEGTPDIDAIASKSNIEKANKKNPLLHPELRNGKIGASQQKGASTNGSRTLESSSRKNHTGETKTNVPEGRSRENRAGNTRGEASKAERQRALDEDQRTTARDYYGDGARVRDAVSESEKLALEVSSRSGVGDVPTRIVEDASEDAPHGTTHIDEDGNVEYVLLNSYHDAGDVGRTCSGAHEATHVGFAKFFGKNWKGGVKFAFEEFKRQNPRLANLADAVMDDIADNYLAENYYAEFFSFIAGGDVELSYDTDYAFERYDELQREIRRFLVDIDVVAKNQYKGVPTISDYYNALHDSNKTVLASNRASDGRSNRDMQSQQRANEEEAYRQQRYSDTHGTDNAAGWAREQRNSQKEQSSTDEEGNNLFAAKQAFGEETHRQVENTAKGISELYERRGKNGRRERNRNARHMDRLVASVKALADGRLTIREFASEYHSYAEEENADTVGYFYDKAIDNRLKRISEYQMNEYGEYSKEARQMISETMQMLEHRTERLLSARGTNAKANAEVKNNGSAVPKSNTFFEKYWFKQLRPDIFFNRLGGYDKTGSTTVYDISKQSADSTKRKINVQTAAQNYFHNAMSNAKAYADFAQGKTKITTEIPGLGRSVSMNEALGLLRTLETEGAIEHIVKAAERDASDDSFGTVFSNSEEELFSGKNGSGFLNPNRISLLSESAMQTLQDAYETDSKQRGRAIAQARAKATLELQALAKSLRAEVEADAVASKFDKAITQAMRMLGKEVDATYMNMYGVKAAKQGKTYWPLSIAGTGNNAELMSSLLSGLKNLSITQERTGPSGSLRIMTATDVMAHYIDTASDFAAFAGLSDQLELMSKTYRGDVSFKAQIEKSFGKEAGKWLDRYVNSLNGVHSDRDSLGATIRGHLAQSALLLNGGVALKQTPSYFDAIGAGIDFDVAMKAWRPFRSAKAWSNNPLISAISGRSGILSARASGLFDPDVGDMSRRSKDLSAKILDRLPKFMTNWIAKSDVRTVSNVLLACKMQIEKEGGYTVGSSDYYDVIARRFEDVVLRTQPNYTEQFRAEYQRSDNEFVRAVAMFRSQQTQNLNQLVNAVGEYDAAVRTGNAKAAQDAKRTMYQTAAGQFVGGVLFGVLSGVARGLLRKEDKFEDKDGNITFASVAKRVGLDTAESLAGTVWFGDVVAKALVDVISNAATGGKGTKEFYSVSDNVISGFNDMLTNLIKFASKPTKKQGWNLAFSLSQLTGLPIRNCYDLVNAVIADVATIGGIAGFTVDDDSGKTIAVSDALANAAAKVEAKDGKNDSNDEELSELDKQVQLAKKEASLYDSSTDGAALKKILAAKLSDDDTDYYVEKYLSKTYRSVYFVLREAGFTPSEVVERYSAIDAMDKENGNLSQKEMYAYYKEHPESNALIAVIYNSRGYKKYPTWSDYVKNH